MTVEYDANVGTACTALNLKDTVIHQVLCRFEFYLLIIFHASLRYALQMEYFLPDETNLTLPMSLTGVTGSLMTFFVVFYNGNVFGRYNKFYDLTKQLNENCLTVVSSLIRELSNPPLKRKLIKMILASCFLFFFERTPSVSEGDEDTHNVSPSEWAALLRLGLIDQQQEIRLKEHCRTLKQNSMPSLLLLHWSMKLYRLETEKNNELEKAYWEIRRVQDDVVEMLELPMPWQYFHIMNLMMMLNLILWAYAFALEPSHFASPIFVFVAAIFMGIRELSVALADPYGDDAADFPINDWMNQLYVRVQYLSNEDFTAEDMMLQSSGGPLPEIKDGSCVVDLLTDLHAAECEPTKSSKKKMRISMATKKRMQAKHDEISREVDGSGSYRQIPAMVESEDEANHNYFYAD